VDVDEASPYTVCINPMEGSKDNPDIRPFIAGQLVHLIKSYNESTNTWGPVLESNLKHLLLLAMCHPNGGTIADAARMLEDDDFLEWLLSKTSSSTLRAFFSRLRASKGSETGWDSWRPYLLPRLLPFASSIPVRRIIQHESTLNLSSAMDQQKILIFRLAKASISELDCQLLGTTLMLEFRRAALARARKPLEKRPLFRLVVDEFQTFASDALPNFFREARKFNVGLCVATQSMSSLVSFGGQKTLMDAVLANTATKIIFRASPTDGAFLTDYTEPTFNAGDLARTRNYEAVVAMSAGDVPPLRAKMLRPDESLAARFEDVLGTVKTNCAKLTTDVDEYLERRHSN
jgi:DNA helicase HerA-like ATPase